MATLGRQGVIQCLVQFFKSRCGNPSLIQDANTNVRHLCGYDTNLPGWRLLSETISYLPPIASAGYTLKATDMDKLATIGQIADALITPPQKTPRKTGRTGQAKFLALAHERSNN
jgi:hypothetical protein